MTKQPETLAECPRNTRKDAKRIRLSRLPRSVLALLRGLLAYLAGSLPSSARGPLLGGASIALALVLAGCQEKDKYTLRFSHALHVTENGIACADCHGEIKDGRLARPGHPVCVDCHDAVTQTNEVSAATCGMCHKEKNLREIAKYPQPASAPSGLFTHTPALKSECANCHETILASKLDHVPPMSRREVIRIRQKSHDSGRSCDVCHSDMSPLVSPASHKKDWKRRHGGEADQADAVCSVCHQEETCRECHKATKPSSHNNLWRLKTHGIEASWERAKCQTCHEEDSCVACHAETRPRSHDAGWRDRHCDQCHPSLSKGTGCETCHRNGLDAHPNPHAAGWRNQHCYECHPGTPEANQCILCHAGGVGAHPNPHVGGWRSEHCTRCHIGEPDGNQCLICHEGVPGHPDPHPGNWRSQHCNDCHLDTPQSGQCLVCHTGGLNAHPDPHAAGWLHQHCNECHPGTAQGDQCIICHAGGVGAHPNPHPGNWLSQHCNDCHPGTTDGDRCQICHTGGVHAHPNPHPGNWLSQHCNDCHPGTTDGDRCQICHTGGVEAHPNPHSAGWQSQHCNECHPGTPDGDRCQICHARDSHPDPHPAGWRSGHCSRCHDSGSTSCNDCHASAGGTVVTLHDGVWPGWHTTDGINDQTDCFESGCHDTGKFRRTKLHKSSPKPNKPQARADR